MQPSLFDMNLKSANAGIPFEDELARKLKRFQWRSQPFPNWMYNANDEPVLTMTTLELRAAREFDKKGKSRVFLERSLHCPDLEGSIDENQLTELQRRLCRDPGGGGELIHLGQFAAGARRRVDVN